MQSIINFAVFALILGSIITVHEFGHFIAAKYFGVYCSHFSIGFGPKILSKKGKETEYEIRLLPIGGFVAMAGEADQEEMTELLDVPFERTLQGKKTYQRVIIFLAGVFMNFVLAFAVLFASNMFGARVPLDILQIGTVQENSPAQLSGLLNDDIVQKIYIEDSGKLFVIDKYEDLPKNFDKATFETTENSVDAIITVKRGDLVKEIPVTMEFNEKTNKYYLGITHKSRTLTLVEGFKYTYDDVAYMSTAIFDALKQLVINFSGTVGQLSGPAGIYSVTAEVTESGSIINLMRLLGMLSINIGIFNLMPIPGLDGCQVLFAVVERIIGRELPQKLKLILQFAGLALVMLLMIYVTFQDLIKIWG